MRTLPPTAVPDRLTTCVPAPALSDIVSVPVCSPVRVGVKMSLIWQLAFGARISPQVVSTFEKSGVTAIFKILMTVEEILLSKTICGVINRSTD